MGVGTANFIDPGCSVKIIDGIREYCAGKNISNIKELVGSLEAGQDAAN